MIDPPEIIQTVAQPTAIIPLKIPKDQIQHVMGPGLRELMSTIAAQAITPTGSWFTHHLKISPDQWDFEIGVPVIRTVIAAGRVKPSQWPAMKVARTIYHGGYTGLGAAWGEFGGWLEANGHEAGKDLWEFYPAGPDSGSDPTQWRTELNRPLVR